MTLLSDNANRILSAMDEARVGLIVQLCDNGIIPTALGTSRRRAVKNLLMDKRVSNISDEDAEYWLDWFSVA